MFEREIECTRRKRIEGERKKEKERKIPKGRVERNPYENESGCKKVESRTQNEMRKVIVCYCTVWSHKVGVTLHVSV